MSSRSAVRVSSLLHSSFRLRPSHRSQALQLVRKARPVQHSRCRYSTVAGPGLESKTSLVKRAVFFAVRAAVFTTFGFAMATVALANTMSAAQNGTLPNAPADAEAQAIEDHINAHPVVAELRAQSPDRFRETRPHMQIPPVVRQFSLTAGTLMGAGRMTVPPFDWTEKEGKSYVQIAHLGADLCGHPGIVHGGFLATMLDEGLARCCFPALPHNIGMTANLNINYRAPCPAGDYVVLHATTTKVEGRKAWVEGRIESLVGPGETPVVFAEATALFISPKHAATMRKLIPAPKKE